jgi:DNA polymerase-3 subunit alpha
MKKYPELYEYASKLQGLTRNWSVHAAGVVIGDRPLYEVIPLRIDAKTGLVVTQWEKTRCENNGLIKMDILGVKTLTVIDEVFRIIESTTGANLSIEDIPLNDSDTFDMIGRGETSGVFQLESSLTPLCMKIKPRDIDGISDINALGRPSCSREQRQSYISRLIGEEEITYRHPNLKNALEKTHGVSLYEEGMMTIAKDCAGWDLNQADALRKITKLKGKQPELVLETETNFIKDCMKHSGMDYKKALEIWKEEIECFGFYGFNKSLLISELVSIIPLGDSKWVTTALCDVKPGSMIRSRDEVSGEDITVEITAKHDHGKLKIFEVELDTGEIVRCTINHKFRTTTGKMLPLHQIIKENLEIVVFAGKQPNHQKD